MAERGSPRSNIYTVLALIALLCLLFAIGFLWYRSSELFGPGGPFEVRQVGAAIGGFLSAAL